MHSVKKKTNLRINKKKLHNNKLRMFFFTYMEPVK